MSSEKLEPTMGHYTPAQVAAIKGTTRAGVYSAIHDGRLASVLIYGRRVVPAEALAEWNPELNARERGRLGGVAAWKRKQDKQAGA